MIAPSKRSDFIHVREVLQSYEGRMHSVHQRWLAQHNMLMIPNELRIYSVAHSETREWRIDVVFFQEWVRRLTWAEVLIVWETKTVIGPHGPIMTQRTLLGILGWRLRLHFFHRGDEEGYHSHPRGFVSVCLVGSYREHLWPNSWRTVRPGTVTVRKPSDAHNVTPLKFPCITLAITTPVIAEWRKFKAGGDR